MIRDFSKEAPNVVTEYMFKELVRKGATVELVARRRAYRKAGVWYGLWIVRVVDPAQGTEQLLVSSRDHIKVREFKTVNGLVSFFDSIGFGSIAIPFADGGREVQRSPFAGGRGGDSE